MEGSTTSFKPITFIMRAREIEQSLKSIAKFPYAKIWVEYYREKAIMQTVWPQVFPEILAKGYTHIGIFSDDAWCEPQVVKMIYRAALKFPVTCGWCDNGSGIVNITNKPLTHKNPQHNDWRIGKDLMTKKEVEKYPEPFIRTWFTGFSLHVMSTELWKRFPFVCNTSASQFGCASDQLICWHLQQAGIPITALRDAKIGHLRKELKYTDINKHYVNRRPANIRWEE